MFGTRHVGKARCRDYKRSQMACDICAACLQASVHLERYAVPCMHKGASGLHTIASLSVSVQVHERAHSIGSGTVLVPTSAMSTCCTGCNGTELRGGRVPVAAVRTPCLCAAMMCARPGGRSLLCCAIMSRSSGLAAVGVAMSRSRMASRNAASWVAWSKGSGGPRVPVRAPADVPCLRAALAHCTAVRGAPGDTVCAAAVLVARFRRKPELVPIAPSTARRLRSCMCCHSGDGT